MPGQSWADRTDSGLDRPLPRSYTTDRDSDDGETEDEGNSATNSDTLKLSEDNSSFVGSAFSSTLNNSERRRIRKGFPTPETPETRCPKLDSIYKSVKADFKSQDSEPSRLQAFMLDPVAPLLHLLHNIDENPDYTVDEIRRDTTEAIQLLGKASSQVSKIQRKRILKAVNPDIQDLVNEEKNFKEAAPLLFGEGFEKKMKDRAESLKLLQKAKPPGSQAPKKFFRGGRPTVPPRRNGQSYRGKGAWNKRDKSK